MRFERTGAFPHLDKVSFTSDAERAAFDADVERVAAEQGLDAPLVARWAEALAGESIFTPWRAYAAIPADRWDAKVA